MRASRTIAEHREESWQPYIHRQRAEGIPEFGPSPAPEARLTCSPKTRPVIKRGRGAGGANAAQSVQRGTDYRDLEGSAGGQECAGGDPALRDRRGDVLPVAGAVRGGGDEARRMGQLEQENRRLKQMVAELSLDKEVLKSVIAKNGLRR